MMILCIFLLLLLTVNAYKCPNSFNGIEFRKATPGATKLDTCSKQGGFTCCSIENDDFLSRWDALCRLSASSDCCDNWLTLRCGACDGTLAMGLTGICPSLSSRLYNSCKGIDVSIDVLGRPSLCTSDSLICSKLEDVMPSHEIFLHSLGFSLYQSPNTDSHGSSNSNENSNTFISPTCFNGDAIPPSQEILANLEVDLNKFQQKKSKSEVEDEIKKTEKSSSGIDSELINSFLKYLQTSKELQMLLIGLLSLIFLLIVVLVVVIIRANKQPQLDIDEIRAKRLAKFE